MGSVVSKIDVRAPIAFVSSFVCLFQGFRLLDRSRIARTTRMSAAELLSESDQLVSRRNESPGT